MKYNENSAILMKYKNILNPECQIIGEIYTAIQAAFYCCLVSKRVHSSRDDDLPVYMPDLQI